MDQFPPSVPEIPHTEIPAFVNSPSPVKKHTRSLLPLIVLVLILPLVIAAVLLRQNITGKAKAPSPAVGTTP